MKIGDLIRSTAVVSGCQLAGKGLALFKTLIVAAAFGTSRSLDAFWVAYVLPTMLPDVIKGVISTAFIPRFMKTLDRKDGQADWRGANTLFTVTLLLITGITICLAVFTPAVVRAVAPGLPPDTHALAVELMRSMLLATVILGINAILVTLAYCHQRFAAAALEPLVTNACIILGIWWLVPYFGIYALVLSVVAGFAIQTLVLLTASGGTVMRWIRPALYLRHPDFRVPLAYMLPLAVGFGGAIIMSVVDQVFVSFLSAGAISALHYASMLAMLPFEVFSKAIMTTFFPALSRHYANDDVPAMVDTHRRGLQLMLFLILPSAVVLVVFAEPIITLLLERGEFTQDSTSLTAFALMFLAIGIISRSVSYLNFRVLHAMRQPWTQVMIGLAGVVTNAMGNFLLVGPFGLGGVALATALALTQNAVVSTLILERRLQVSVAWPIVQTMLRLGVMVGLAVLVAWWSGTGIVNWLTPEKEWLQALYLLLGLAPGLMVFLMAGRLLQQQEVMALLAWARHFLRRHQGVAASASEH